MMASASLAVAAPGSAADSAADKTGGDSAPALAVTQAAALDEIVVTAQKREERLMDVPIAISVVSGAALDSSSYSGITDVLTQIPGVTAQTNVQGGGTVIGIRGVSAAGPTYNGSSPIGYYVDSVPFGFVKSTVVPDANPYDLQRIEVLRGPQGTLYGAGGENGLVRILTNDANLNDFELKGRATLSTTDGGGLNYRGDMAINIPIIDGRLAVRGVVGYANLGGWVDGADQNHINDAELRTYRLKINALPTDELSIGLSAWSSRDNYGAPSVSDDDRRSKAAMGEPIIDDFDAYGAKIAYDFQSFSVVSETSYIDYTNLGNLDLTSLGVPGLGLQTGLDARVAAEEFRLNSAPASSWRWSAGFFYRDANDKFTSVFEYPGAVFSTYRDRSKSDAVFGELSHRFLDDKLEWTLGLRYFHDDESTNGNYTTSDAILYHGSDSFNATTPRAVLTWYPSKELMAYASYSEGFRSGYVQSAAIAQLYPAFPPVKPDKLHNFEIGSKGDFFNNLLSIDSALYYMRWDDVQLTLEVPFTNNATITAPVNGRSASGIGVDFGLTLRPFPGFDVGGNISWNDLSLDHAVVASGFVVFPQGARLDYSSATTGSVFSDYVFDYGGSGFQGKFSISASYTSPQQDRIFTAAGPPFISQGSAFLIPRLSYTTTWRRNLSATLFIDNFTNDYGRYPTIAQGVNDWYPRVRPRTAGIQFDYHL